MEKDSEPFRPRVMRRHGNDAGEALTGAHAGQPLSSEITNSACRPCSDRGKATLMGDANRKPLHGRRGVEDPEHAWKLYAREPGDPGNSDGKAGTVRKGQCRTPDMHVSRESDGPIVPEKRANKAGLKAAAESVEGRGSTKGNAERTLLAPDTEPGKRRRIGLRGVRDEQSKSRSYTPKVRAV